MRRAAQEENEEEEEKVFRLSLSLSSYDELQHHPT
jgi:hypothetical protein